MPEVVEEKQGPPPAVSAGAPRRLFAKLARLGVVLGALCWAATLAFALSRWEALGARSVTWGRLELSPLGLGLGALVGGLGLAGFLKKFGGLLEWHKPGQATVARAVAFTCLGALTMYGGYAFYQLPSTASVWWMDLWKAEVFGKVFSLKPILFPSAGVFLTVMTAIFLLLNRAKWADFLIETEGELKKVSWPARKDYVGSAVVVVVVVAVISLFLFFVDKGLSEVMRWAGMGF